jgi:uncharacterized membrane protein YkvI
MAINYPAELAVCLRFGVACLALALSYMFVLSLVHKYQGGLYAETAIPSPVTPAMRRARAFFVMVVVAVAMAAGAGAFLLHPLVSTSTWFNVVWPAVGGIGFAMLYGGVTRYDRIRPRQE